jgi:hypothetical protein
MRLGKEYQKKRLIDAKPGNPQEELPDYDSCYLGLFTTIGKSGPQDVRHGQ